MIHGLNSRDFHDSWTKQSCEEKVHQFNSNDATTILSAVKEDLGVAFLPCFIGDIDRSLERYCDPQPKFDLGLWVLSHPELKNNARVLAFRNHLIQAIEKQHQLLQGIPEN